MKRVSFTSGTAIWVPANVFHLHLSIYIGTQILYSLNIVYLPGYETFLCSFDVHLRCNDVLTYHFLLIFSSGVKNDGITRILLGPTLRSPLARKSADLIGLFNHVWRHGVKETLASGLRRCAGWGFLCARPGGRYGVPLLGFVGLTMMSTSGPGLITDHDEFKAICEQIRVCVFNSCIKSISSICTHNPFRMAEFH